MAKRSINGLMPRPIAYSYIRFSTPQQELGDSERRQVEDSRAYAELNGFTLDESIGVDRGLSGFTGSNIVNGALGEFIKRIEAKQIKEGSALFVESADRVSRQPFSECWPTYQRILKGGIEIHFFSTHDILKPNHSFTDILRVGVNIDRSNSESAIKSERLTKVWGKKKHNSPKGIAISNRNPGWIDGKTHGQMTVNEAKGKVVVQIFEMAAFGMGKRLIARRLNDKKVPTFGKSPTWGHSYIQKILLNRAVLGEYQPHKGKTSNRKRAGNRKRDGEVRTDFFPPVITPELWDRAHKAISSRHTISVKGNSTGKFGGRTGVLHNLFAGLVFDANFGLPMHYGDKGKRDRPRLTTNSKEINGSTPNSVVYVDFEEPFLHWLGAVDWSTVVDAADTEGIRKIEEEIASLNLSITRTREKSQRLTDYLLTLANPAATINERLLKLQDEEAGFKKELENAEARLAEAESKYRDFTDETLDIEALSQTKDVATRARIRQEIRRKVARIDFWFYPDKHTPALVHEEEDLFPFARVRFTNGEERFIVLLSNSSLVSSQFAPTENFEFHAPVKLKKIIKALRESRKSSKA
jgi:DNA invertase Pin-like site-specific DNA recombinase